ncbi:MAG: phospho-sugar mutase [Eubacteriales bacterium]
MENYEKEYLRWCQCSDDPEISAALDEMKNDGEKKKFYFHAPLEFGTAGLRGTMTAGINAMNVYTVAQSTQGFASFILAAAPENPSCAIAYDSRINSERFARVTASVMAANGVKTYIFDALRPTPVLSFAIRELKLTAGVNITASHNPKQYSGYKAYWSDGAQLAPEQADAVSAAIKKTDIFGGVKTGDFDKLAAEGKIIILGEAFDEKYIERVCAEIVNPTAIPAVADDFTVVYSPLHGAGVRIVPEVLRRVGMKHVIPVAEQCVPDGSFPTVKFPNPEFPEVFALGIDLAEKAGSDLIVATDPDADRTGVMVRGSDGGFVCLTGNQVGALLIDYIARAMDERGGVPADAYAVKTIVSTSLAAAVCKKWNIRLHDVLTGFKFIGEVMTNYANSGRGTFVLGFEESYGYLKGDYARDKDAVVATMLIVEMAAYYKAKGMTLYDAMQKMYETYGFYTEGVDNIYMEGLDGIERMAALMDKLRQSAPASLAGENVRYVRDYIAKTITDKKTGKTEPTGLPASNVLYFETEEGDCAIVRPSGTEPKVKIYYLLRSSGKAESEEKLAAFKSAMKDIIG